jgi:ADP-heptose:LPS heptosyltransferase
MPQKLILTSNLCPGDLLTLTAAVESLHLTYPGEYLTDVRTPAREIWEHNPHLTPLEDADPEARKIECHYPSIGRCNQEPVSFLAGYTEHLGEQLGRPLRCRVNRPCLYLSDAERAWQDQVSQHVTGGKRIPFWLVNAGVKNDYTAKSWPVEHYQSVINMTRGRIQWVQVGAREHTHPELRGVIDFRGKTDHRQLIRLAYHAAGGLGPVTYLQHLCAAWQKPYVCLLGGREPVPWTSYPTQHTLHTIGLLDCCRDKACWRSRTVPIGDSDAKDSSLCDWPVLGLLRPSPKCLAAITPHQVVSVLDRILSVGGALRAPPRPEAAPGSP